MAAHTARQTQEEVNSPQTDAVRNKPKSLHRSHHDRETRLDVPTMVLPALLTRGPRLKPRLHQPLTPEVPITATNRSTSDLLFAKHSQHAHTTTTGRHTSESSKLPSSFRLLIKLLLPDLDRLLRDHCTRLLRLHRPLNLITDRSQIPRIGHTRG